MLSLSVRIVGFCGVCLAMFYSGIPALRWVGFLLLLSGTIALGLSTDLGVAKALHRGD